NSVHVRRRNGVRVAGFSGFSGAPTKALTQVLSGQAEVAPRFEQTESHSAIVLLPGQGGPGESAKYGFATVEARGRDLVAETTVAAGYSPFLFPSCLERFPTNCDSNISAGKLRL